MWFSLSHQRPLRKVIKSPFSCAVQGRPRTFWQSRRKRLSTSAASVNRLGSTETAIGSIGRPDLTLRPGMRGSAVWHDAQAGVCGLPPAWGPRYSTSPRAAEKPAKSGVSAFACRAYVSRITSRAGSPAMATPLRQSSPAASTAAVPAPVFGRRREDGRARGEPPGERRVFRQ